ncbi:MAG: ArsR family transcriptional regulator [Lachnospiraceae bacterium]|nr:ArsR family transcriptional regulator [Lachnospiraceae bacterium]
MRACRDPAVSHHLRILKDAGFYTDWNND